MHTVTYLDKFKPFKQFYCRTSHYWDKETRSYNTCSVLSTLAACIPAGCIKIATSCLSCCAPFRPYILIIARDTLQAEQII